MKVIRVQNLGVSTLLGIGGIGACLAGDYGWQLWSVSAVLIVMGLCGASVKIIDE